MQIPIHPYNDSHFNHFRINFWLFIYSETPFTISQTESKMYNRQKVPNRRSMEFFIFFANKKTENHCVIQTATFSFLELNENSFDANPRDEKMQLIARASFSSFPSAEMNITSSQCREYIGWNVLLHFCCYFLLSIWQNFWYCSMGTWLFETTNLVHHI